MLRQAGNGENGDHNCVKISLVSVNAGKENCKVKGTDSDVQNSSGIFFHCCFVYIKKKKVKTERHFG